MKLTTTALSRNHGLVRPRAWLSWAALAGLALLEAVGRTLTSDLLDALAAAALAVLLGGLAAGHREALVLAGQRLARRWAAGLASWRFKLGVDLRGEPGVPRGFPPALLAGMAVLGGWCLLAAAAGLWLPADWCRWLGTRSFYLGYLLAVSSLWVLVVAAAVLCLFLPAAVWQDARGGADARRPGPSWVALYLAVLAVMGLALPVWVPLLICLAAVALNALAVLLPANTSVQFLWQPLGSRQVRAIPWAAWSVVEFSAVALALAALVLTACGGRALGLAGDAATEMPVTLVLGAALAWLSPGLLLALLAQAVSGRWRDPARRVVPVAHVAGRLTAGDREGACRSFAARGWRVRFAPTPYRTGDVRVEVVPPEQSEATEFEPRWPLRVSLADLEDGAVFARLDRRVEVLARRSASGGLEKFFKRAAARRSAGGHGYWIAPHFWFFPGVTRDGEEADPDRVGESRQPPGVVGPPYHRMMSRAARHHLYQVLRATQVDLVFVEDGVKFRRFNRVLRKLYDVYDRHAGRRRAEDRDFVGLPGLRVIIHEFAFEEPFKSESYPEPKYDNLGRARILHVFRDRGESEEPLETPFDWSSSPAPLMAL